MSGKIITSVLGAFIFAGSVAAKPNRPFEKSAVHVANYTGYSFLAHKCWHLVGTDQTVYLSDNVDITPTRNCAKGEQGTWGIGIDSYVGNYPSKVFLSDEKRLHTIVHSEKKLVDGRLTYFGEEVKPESDPLIDRKDQDNYAWIGKVVCGRRNFNIGYTDHLDKKGRGLARKSHLMPDVYVYLLNSFKCPPKSPLKHQKKK